MINVRILIKCPYKCCFITQLSSNYGLAQIFQIDFRMASEASKRAEEDRMRRIQLQEEQDLAYAIALSKAEAVSLKQN